MSCTASATIDVSGLRREAKPAADKGTMLHGLAERALTTGVDPSGPKLSPPDVESVMEYVNLVRARKGTKFFEVKTKFVDECGGTSDAVVIEDGEIEIIDYKSGVGYVGPAENTQLIIYALGVVKKFSTVFDFDRVKLTIVQPAIENIASWELSLKTLESWGCEISETIGNIKDGDVEYVPTEDNCRWCPARSICPALARKVQDVAKADFSDTDELTWEEKLELIPLLTAWCKGVAGATNAMLLAGDVIPGWKVVQGRKGNRAWKNEGRVVKFLREKWKLTAKQIYKPQQLLTPSAIETLVKKDPKRLKAALGRLIVEGADGAPTVVPESDSRKAMDSAALARRDFAGVVDGDD